MKLPIKRQQAKLNKKTHKDGGSQVVKKLHFTSILRIEHVPLSMHLKNKILENALLMPETQSQL